MRRVPVAAGLLFLATAGAATAIAVDRTITIKPGHCKKVSKSLRVCARKAPRVTVRTTVTTTTTQTVTTTPQPQVAFSDGTYVVGSQIVAGTYETVDAVASDGLCYWARLSGFGGTIDDIIANDDVFSGHAIVAIASTDAGFTSDGCGSWTKIS
jgi:hypothetical protein